MDILGGLIIDEAVKEFATRGDLAHLALALWAFAASALSIWSLRELVAANRRFDTFVEEIARLNGLIDTERD